MPSNPQSTDFDPYHKWLGIKKSDQPPHHYRLLALDVFEDDPEVIEAAADRQMTYVQQCASGEYLQQSQAILNELSQARVELLNQEKKKSYDTKLRNKLKEVRRKAGEASQSAREKTSVSEPPAPLIQPSKSSTNVRTRRKMRTPPSLTLAGIGVTIVALVFILIAITGDDEDKSNSDEKTRVAKSERLDSGRSFAEKSLAKSKTAAAKTAATKTVNVVQAKTETEPTPKQPVDAPKPRVTAIPGHGGIPGVDITSGGSVELASLRAGANIDSGTSGFRRFSGVPPEVEGRNYTLMKGHKGVLRFTVIDDVPVFLAVPSDWGGGGSRGSWYQEVVPREKLERDGWKEIGKCSVTKFGAFTVFRRDCKADEKFAIRTHKYAPPFLIAP